MNTVTQIGTIISKLRKEKGITQEELAKYVGVSAQAVSKWENGGVPDTELLPKIADYFNISTDVLFGREHIGKDVSAAIYEHISKHDFNSPLRFSEGFELCWALERALFIRKDLHKDFGTIDVSKDRVADYEKRLDKTEQTYSQVCSNHGFTQMGVANRLQYFLMVPEIKDKKVALFDGIDYKSFFEILAKEDLFQALLLLYSRDERKYFTENLLVRELSVSRERAMELIQLLKKINLVSTRELELDDIVRNVYIFVPNTAFIALLIFAREMIDRPNKFSYNSGFRTKPFL